MEQELKRISTLLEELLKKHNENTLRLDRIENALSLMDTAPPSPQYSVDFLDKPGPKSYRRRRQGPSSALGTMMRSEDMMRSQTSVQFGEAVDSGSGQSTPRNASSMHRSKSRTYMPLTNDWSVERSTTFVADEADEELREEAKLLQSATSSTSPPPQRSTFREMLSGHPIDVEGWLSVTASASSEGLVLAQVSIHFSLLDTGSDSSASAVRSCSPHT